MLLANVLFVPPGLPWLIQAAAAVILALHIGGGVVGIVSGFAALALRKGGRWHRLAGNVFFVAMLAMSGIGATVAPFLPDWGSAIAGLFTFYLVLTGWMVVRRKAGQIGRFEVAAIGLPLIAVVAELTFAWLATHNPKGTFEGLPPFPMYLIASVATLAVVADLTVIRRGGLHGAQRIARHLWRLCVGLLIATGSALAQPKIVPATVHTPLLLAPILVILAVMTFWLLRVAFSSQFKPTRRRAARPVAVEGPALGNA